MLVVRVTKNVRAVQSSYYSGCPCVNTSRKNPLEFYPVETSRRADPTGRPDSYPDIVNAPLARYS
jgi:hypothetical protein